MRSWRVAALVSCAVLIGTPSRADECIGPANARLFASESGIHILRVGQKRGQLPEGTLIAIRDDFGEQRIWRARLINVPARVIVTDDGRTVVTIDNAGCGFGREHSVVVYGERGRMIADLRLEDILDPDEIQRQIPHSMAGRLWTEKASFSFNRVSGALAIAFDWGRHVTIDLLTGKVTR
jgi:hypothetical protein